jgi:hypothetical protein
MLELVRALSDATHQIIIVSERLQKELEENARKAADLATKKNAYEELDRRLAAKATELADLEQRYAEIKQAWNDLKSRL